MKQTVWVLVVVLAAAGVATAVDVPMRDGTVVTADSYRVTGSFVMIDMSDGSQVAFDVADVDLPALREAEAAAAAATGDRAEPEPQQRSDTISSGRALKSVGAAGDEQTGGLTITDRDVKHLRGSGVRGENEQQQADVKGDPGPAQDVQVGGSVVLNNIRVEPAGEGRWRIQGEVVNRNPRPVMNVTVKLETIAAASGEAPWSGEIQVASTLGPDEEAAFEHSFQSEVPEGAGQPSIRASVMWMQEESHREPNYTKAGGVPHPSNLPLQHGGVSGADLRPTPVQ